MFNPWGSNSSGWAALPGKTSKILGQFWANAAFIAQNFDGRARHRGDANGDAVDRAVEELSELAGLGGDSTRRGRFTPAGIGSPAAWWA